MFGKGCSLPSPGSLFRSMAMAEDETVLQAIKGSSLSSTDIVFRSMAMVEDGTVKQW